ncbi:Phage integrase, N-terminal SAM-like domain [Nocardia amikacinitolerans]|uniref:Phage integrase, N-terminal SAM-like domain n=1 Tax=Nocardia amikacinitolerans TaxID=756689 RepID=A0A285LHA4_9NOCA|nr:site-specific integrase [Nocardia amikacinitolerans]SNY84338.1 Phage integrase, N-terminal SAM-like domain [Nocardia amikacinitolerans]
MPPKKRRRPRGEGAFYQRKADSLWIGAVTYEDENGQSRRATVSSSDKAIAMQKFRALRTEIESGTFTPQAKMTVEKWLTYWVDEIVKPNTEPKTYKGYKQIVDNQILPYVGKTKPLPVTPAVVRGNLKWVGERWSGRMVQLTHFVWRKSMEDAKKENIGVRTNPVEYIPKPKAAPKVSGQALKSNDARKVLLAAMEAGDPMVTRWAAAFMLGARQGELLGLEWSRLDLDALTVDLSWQLQTMATKPGASLDDPDRFDVPPGYEIRPLYRKFALKRPKSERSKRLTPLPVPLAAILAEYKKTAPPNPYGLVWVTAKGNPIPQKYDNTWWHEALKRAGVPDVRLHDARHTTATLLQELGVEESVRMQVMGHSSVAAQRIYAHVDLSLARKALGNLDGLLELG